MIKKYDYHVHTTFSDGRNTPEEMIEKALAVGMEELGFSDHSYTFFDGSWCMKKENIGAYQKKIRELAKEYEGRLRIHCGIEQDYLSEEPTNVYDYAIGSMHYFRFGDSYVPIDESPVLLKEGIDRFMGGDMLKACELYYDLEKNMVQKTGCKIIGHFDIIAKFNWQEHWFDENDPRYVKAWQSAVDEILKTDAIFEINYGPVCRKSRDYPFPPRKITDYIAAHGGKFVLSGDTHFVEALGFRTNEVFPENYRFVML